MSSKFIQKEKGTQQNTQSAPSDEPPTDDWKSEDKPEGDSAKEMQNGIM